jgi:hypothetical protein
MARRVVATVKALSIAERPAKVEVEFGLKLDAAAGAIVAQAGVEASINHLTASTNGAHLGGTLESKTPQEQHIRDLRRMSQ